MGWSGLSFLVRLPCWCSPLPRVGSVWVVLLLPVVPPVVFVLWLVVLAVCWWLCLLPLFLLLVSLLPVLSVVVALVPGVQWRLLWVGVGGCCSGCPLALVLLLGLGFPGLLLALSVLLVVGGSVFLLLFRRSCLFSSRSGAFAPSQSLPRSPYDKFQPI